MAKEKTPEALLKGFIIATLRRASYRWPERNKALARARVERGLYKCESCGIVTKKANIQLDHTRPVIPVTGFTNWDDYITRLFCKASDFSVICKACHIVKTSIEAKLRKINRDAKKE